MWIFCGGMPRAASTLQYQIASELVEQNNLGVRVTWHDPDKHAEIFESFKDRKFKVFKSHELTEPINQQFRQNNAVGIYIYRDLRDVVSSLQEKNKRIYDTHNLAILVKHLIQQHNNWVSLKPVYVAKYEHVSKNIGEEIRSIVEFLGIVNNSVSLSQLESQLSIEEQVKYIDNLKSNNSLVTVNERNIYDPVTLLHLNHIASGKIGRHRDDLTPDQLRIIEESSSDWFKDHGYGDIMERSV